MEDIILVGYGGHAKSVADCIERSGKFNIFGYTDLTEHASKYKYLGNDDVLKSYYEKGIKYACICIGYIGKGNLREKIYSVLKDIGYSLPVIADPTVVVSKDVYVGEGTFIGKRAVLNAGSKIGKMCIINTGAIVEHECIVEDFTHISVGTVLCGQVVIKKAAFVGANSTVIQQRIVESGKIVPAGSVVR